MLDEFAHNGSDELDIPADLQSLHEQLARDGEAWDAAQGDADLLAEHALSLAQTGHLFVPVEEVTDESEAPPTSASLMVNDRLARSKHRRQRGLFPYVAVVALLALVGVGFSQFALGHPKAHTGQTLATATPTSAATATVTATATPPATVTPVGLGSGAPATPGFTVQSVTTSSVDMSTDTRYGQMAMQSNTPIPTGIGGCGPQVAFYVTFAITLSNNPTPPNQHAGTTGVIAYYVRNSDGSSSGSAAQPDYEMIPSAGTAMTLTTTWQMPYTQASGASQWTELDIIQPNPISYQANYQALCQFSLTTPEALVSPTSYNCATGGDQTFTLTGTIEASFTPDTTSHTVTYQWETDFKTHGTYSSPQTVTFPPGVTSMQTQPYTVISNAANQTAGFQAFLYVNYGGSQYHSDQLTVTSAC